MNSDGHKGLLLKLVLRHSIGGTPNKPKQNISGNKNASKCFKMCNSKQIELGLTFSVNNWVNVSAHMITSLLLRLQVLGSNSGYARLS